MQTEKERGSTPDDVLKEEEYVIDEDYSGPVYPSQPCNCKRVVYLTPLQVGRRFSKGNKIQFVPVLIQKEISLEKTVIIEYTYHFANVCIMSKL